MRATWAFVEPGIELILGNDEGANVTPMMYMSVYTSIYNYCIIKSRSPTHDQNSPNVNQAALLGGAEIYAKLRDYLTNFVSRMQKPASETFLQFYVRKWIRYTIGAGYLHNVFDYINRYWVRKERDDGRKDIFDVSTLCLLTWKDCMFRPNLDALLGEILKQIELQRLNKDSVSSDLSTAIKSFVALGFDTIDLKKTNLSVYISDFEQRFLDETNDFYEKESLAFLESNNLVDYMRKAETRLSEERSRANLYLDDHTRKPLNDTLNKVLIENHAETMVAQFTYLLDQNQLDDIQRMYELLQRVPSTLEPLLGKFEEYVKHQGTEAAVRLKGTMSDSAPKDTASQLPKMYVKVLLETYHQFEYVVEYSFKQNPLFVKSLDNASRDFINYNVIAQPNPRASSKSAELLAKYSDGFLRKKTKDVDTTADMSIDELMTVFRYLADKDAFETHYRRLLARRLINGNTVSDEDEEAVIQRLKQENSLEYTNKMTNMFSDIKASSDLRVMFQKANSHNTSVGDFNIFVLGQTSWPFPQFNSPFQLPAELSKTEEQFEAMYSKKHSGRKLKWLYNLSRGEIKANLAKPGKPPFLLTVNLFQMSILLPFNDKPTFNFEELMHITGLNREFLESSILPLVRYKLLQQEPEGTGNMAKPLTKFTVVKEYKSKKMKVNFMTGVKYGESKNDTEEAQREVEEDRRNFLQACIVRVMKARKVLRHAALLNEVIQQSHARFKASVGDIKKAIDLLIDKEYLQRVDEDSYEYLA